MIAPYVEFRIRETGSKPVVERTFGVDELISAYIKAQGYRRAAPDLRDYWSTLTVALQQTLRMPIDWPVETSDERVSRLERDSLLILFQSTVESLLSVRTPFDGFMEAPPVVSELYRQHRKAFAATASEYRQIHKDLLLTILTLLFGDLNARATTENLILAGFVGNEPPDPYEFR